VIAGCVKYYTHSLASFSSSFSVCESPVGLRLRTTKATSPAASTAAPTDAPTAATTGKEAASAPLVAELEEEEEEEEARTVVDVAIPWFFMAASTVLASAVVPVVP